MKLCITTAYDERYRQIGALCERTIQQYAQTFGYDYRVYRERLSDRSPHWDKISAVQKLFDEGYEYVLWMDADMLFVCFDQDIRQEIEPNKFFYLTLFTQSFIDMPGVRLDIDYPSFGFFLIQNTPWSCGFLDQLWNNTRYVDTPPRDNGALLESLGYTYYLDRTSRNTYPYAVWQHIKVLDSRWNAIKGVPWVPMAADPILIHYPAQSAEERLHAMQRDYERLVQKKSFSPLTQISHDFAQPMDGEGWHRSEVGTEGLAFRWMGRPITTLEVPLASQWDYAISFRALHAITSETWDMFSLRANDTRLSLRRELAAVGFTYDGMIPRAAITTNGRTTLKFCVDQTRTPGEFVAETTDTRQLGIAVARLELSAIREG